MLTELAWLPRPEDPERARLTQVLADGSDLLAWRRLLAFGWSGSELRRAGVRIQKILQQTPDATAGSGIVPLRLLVIASNTFLHMKDAVVASALRHGIALEVTVCEFLSPQAWLADGANRAEDFDAVLIAADEMSWPLPQAMGLAEEEGLQRLASAITQVMHGFAERGAKSIIVQTVPDNLSELSINFDAVLPGSRTRMLTALNDSLGRAAAQTGHLVLDVARMAAMVGMEAWWPGRYWFSAKIPFSQQCVPLYGDSLGRILAAAVGKSRRVLVLDLDNTCWGGVIGDDGLEGIVLGQGSAAGEAHLAIQRIAKAYAARGVILCVASKNTHEIAIEAFRRHPDMVLREDSIAAFQINWNDKASNIRALAQTLNLGLESFVFLDDNPVERKQVRDALPEVAVPELPEDPADWPVMLQAAGYFEQISFSEEDRQRGEFYKSMAARNEVAVEAGDSDAFLKSLDTVVSIRPFDPVGRKRIAQLVSKSNQFNLTTRRYSEREVELLESDPDAVTMQIRLSDIFGDAGMISVVVARLQDRELFIEAWLMSCRVLGRRVQEAALLALVNRARAIGATKLTGIYLPTERNGIVADHYQNLGFRPLPGDPGDDQTRWELSLEDYSPPELPMKIEIEKWSEKDASHHRPQGLKPDGGDTSEVSQV